MQPSDVRTIDNAKRIVRDRDLKHVKVGVFDMDGILRGKLMSQDKFFSALDTGFGFCDVVIGWDSDDQLYDNVSVTGWHTGYPDAHVRLLPETCRNLPWENGGNGLFFLGEFAGRAEAVGPRAQLRKALAHLEGMGFTANAALEFEFFVFDETPASVREKGYRGLTPITPGNFGYSVLRSAVWSELYEEILSTCEAMDIPIEGLHTETGPGVLEAAITVTNALEAADRAALFKTAIKVLCERRGLMATFMAKWSNDYPGQSGHTHVSLVNADGTSAFHDPDGLHRMSPTMRHFLGGLQRGMPEILAMVSGTVNSYSRLVPGAWAPTNATWGVENRTTALRVIPGSPKSQRVEYRIAAADVNPYLGLAAVLATGAWGIEERMDHTDEIVGNAYTQEQPPELALPTTLWDAAQRLKGSAVARRIFGDTFVEHYAASREWEEREFRKAITDWELRRYFEII